MHTKRLDPIFLQNLLLPRIHIPQPYIHQFPHTDLRLRSQPPKDILSILLRQPCQKRDWHAVDIPTITRLGRIDIRMRIHPYNSHLSPQPFPYRP